MAPIAQLGLDEKSLKKRYHYVRMVVDLNQPHVLHVADDRKASSLAGYFTALTPEQRSGMTAIAMDKWELYGYAVYAHVQDADAKIVLGRQGDPATALLLPLYREARTSFRGWYEWAMHSRREQMKKVTRMLTTHRNRDAFKMALYVHGGRLNLVKRLRRELGTCNPEEPTPLSMK